MSDDINPDRVLEVLQELEAGASGDLVVSYALVMRTVVRSDANLDAYRMVHTGSLSEQLGLLRYATIRAERQVTDAAEDDD